MGEKKLLSVAEIARQLELPESTVHYWKNRFAQHLPSVGKGRQKRFKPEAVEVFSAISTMLRQGHTARDVMDRLGEQFPLQADTVADTPAVVAPTFAPDQMESTMKLASAIGFEIATAIGDGIRNALNPRESGVSAEEMESIRKEIQESASSITGRVDELETLAEENRALKDKLAVMESELIRLRKDRREMEKYLLDKIRSVTS